MVAIALVKENIEAGRQLLGALERTGFLPKYAAWVKQRETMEWEFVLVFVPDVKEYLSPMIRAVVKEFQHLQKSWSEYEAIDVLALSVVDPSHPVAESLQRAAGNRYGVLTPRTKGEFFSNALIEAGYLYPTTLTLAAA